MQQKFVAIAFLLRVVGAYVISISNGVERPFDGIGGLSGGGATSKLLVNYPQPQRDDILDILFKPNYGASLQMLKVEIGGDDQTTDGAESSHSHYGWDLNFERGYEWWLMKEAKKRNPNIKLYALPWAFPNWINPGRRTPYGNLERFANYVVQYLVGAQQQHNLTFDYVGIWNERPCKENYVFELKRQLTANNLSPKIIINDGIIRPFRFKQFLDNDKLMETIYAFGRHYPGTETPRIGIRSGVPLWSSEDYSTFNDNVGAGCWARILNQNYVNGYMTSTIAWNLIASYYPGLPFYRDGLMTAVEPWSGHYNIDNTIWITAHTTLFTNIGWSYLKHGQGVGLLDQGGSYVALTDPTRKQLTIIVETMSHDHSLCVRPALPAYNVSDEQTVVFQKSGQEFSAITELNVWRTTLGFDGKPTDKFVYEGKLKATTDGNVFSFTAKIDSIYTLTTIKQSSVLDPSSLSIPASANFTLPYSDDFENYSIHSEPYDLAQQTGVWEIHSDDESAGSTANKFARQMVVDPPVPWCETIVRPFRPVNVIGDDRWTDRSVTVKFRLPTVNGTNYGNSFYLGLRANATKECRYEVGSGLFLWFYKYDHIPPVLTLSTNLPQTKVLYAAVLTDLADKAFDTWHSMSLSIVGNVASWSLNDDASGSLVLPDDVPAKGMVMLGANSLGIFDIDDLRIK